MTPRFYAELPLREGESLGLQAPVARHVQVLRLQPGDTIRLFNGSVGRESASEGEFDATIERMGRSDVQVAIGAFHASQRESARAVHLAVGMPANERMDWLIEKATELGVASIQPLMSERSVLRIASDRADKKLARWRGVAIAACEQCGRNRVPLIHDATGLGDWLRAEAARPASAGVSEQRLLLSLQPASRVLRQAVAAQGEVTFLSGPEGGFSPPEEAAALALGFVAATLGPRVLRAETAPLAALALLTLSDGAV